MCARSNFDDELVKDAPNTPEYFRKRGSVVLLLTPDRLLGTEIFFDSFNKDVRKLLFDGGKKNYETSRNGCTEFSHRKRYKNRHLSLELQPLCDGVV